MRFNPRREVEYRIQLSREYLEDAERCNASRDFKGCAQYSQLAVENAAKAVIATRRTPSWGHDPSTELLEVARELQSDQMAETSRLAEISSQVAPEHGRTTYGEPERFLTPHMLYDAKAAERAITLAREAIGLMNQLLEPTSEPKES